MRKLIAGGAVGIALLATAGAAQETPASHTLVTPLEVQWVDPPPALPKGATVAILAGDPTKPAPFVIRVKAPAGYRIMPHWHPTNENVTVLSGTLAIGMGEKFDRAALKALPAGSYTLMPAEMRHFATARTPTVFQIHGTGPFTLTYVNPDDDPRKAATK
jgi:hypothetical protein